MVARNSTNKSNLIKVRGNWELIRHIGLAEWLVKMRKAEVQLFCIMQSLLGDNLNNPCFGGWHLGIRGCASVTDPGSCYKRTTESGHSVEGAAHEEESWVARGWKEMSELDVKSPPWHCITTRENYCTISSPPLMEDFKGGYHKFSSREMPLIMERLQAMERLMDGNMEGHLCGC